MAQQFDVHPNQITQWRGQLLEGATAVFGDGAKADAAPAVDLKVLHAKIGELTLANDFLAGALGKAGLLGERKTMIDRSHELPLAGQAKALGTSRGSVYIWPDRPRTLISL